MNLRRNFNHQNCTKFTKLFISSLLFQENSAVCTVLTKAEKKTRKKALRKEAKVGIYVKFTIKVFNVKKVTHILYINLRIYSKFYWK